MKRISLDAYRGSSIYLYLFEAIMKKQGLNKDDFLIEHGISPSSYRRARNSEQNIGIEIMTNLASYFQFKLLSSKEIDEMEELLNQIYDEAYYKIYDNFEYFFKRIQEELENKNILFPILQIFKIFLDMNELKLKEDMIDQNMVLFEEIKKYKKFLTKELMVIYEIINIQYMKDIPEDYAVKEFDNGLIYYSLSSSYSFKNEFTKSLYYAEKVRNIFLKENNFARMHHFNLTIISNYNALNNFEKGYELAHSQILSLKALDRRNKDYEMTIRHLVVACLGLGKYQEALKLLGERGKYTSTEIYCLLIAAYYADKKKYEETYKSILPSLKQNIDNADDVIVIEALNSLLRKKDKESLSILEKCNLNYNLFNIFKKIFLE
ncbi:MAG: hypothetical protein NC310_02960 [Roseburia sp.]|nr:hypothetical protein [Anaeroplasma bactoclasticum]MCM1196018.1 hypothetical protein [Roseburia sp.]